MPTNSKKSNKDSSPRIVRAFKKARSNMKKRIDGYLARRPHRSFRLTKRRDYTRSLTLPGIFAFTAQVNKTVWTHRKPFLGLMIVYALLTSIFIGIGSQDIYSQLTTTLQETGSEIFQGNVGELGKAALLLASIGTSGLTGELNEGQQAYTALLGVLIWLTTIWLLRNFVAGNAVKLRDGLYNGGAPIISSLIVVLVLVVQLLPVALATIGYSAALQTGLLDGGVVTMLFWIIAILLGVMSLYWVSSTFFALIIVTLPGMYPIRALRTAGDMLIGRRVRVLLRILWMFVPIVLAWVVVMIPFILFDSWIKSVFPQIAAAPIVPVLLLIISTLTIIWSASYVYLLYRRVVDDDAKPA